MKKAFTLLELVFVIVIIGILANFGTNILMTTYTSYTASSVNNKILADTELALKQISNRLQYRIKDSVIARTAPNAAPFRAVASAAVGDTVLEWIGYDIDGWLGAPNLPTWSGFIDIDDPGAINSQLGVTPYLESPGTNTAAITATIAALANGSANTVADAAIFFTGANSNVQAGFGWNGAAEVNQTTARAHSIAGAGGLLVTRLQDGTPGPSSFTGTDIYENYKLAWTAYSISLEDFNNLGEVYPIGHPLAGNVIQDLVLYYDYQPWNGVVAPVAIPNPRRQLLLKNVDTFKFQAVGETIKIEICVNEQDILGTQDGGYAVCEEIAIF